MQWGTPALDVWGFGAAQEGKGKAGQVGPFEKKWLMLAVQDLEARGGAREPLGRVVVNLADFAAEDGRATQVWHRAGTGVRV